MLHIPFSDEDDLVLPVVQTEELTDEEARAYADSLTPEEAREHLNALLNSPYEDDLRGQR